jgi:hypothetical protein
VSDLCWQGKFDNSQTDLALRSKEKRSLLASADAKGDVYRDRFNLIRQRVLRNENFLPPSLQIIDNDSYLKVRIGIDNVWHK